MGAQPPCPPTARGEQPGHPVSQLTPPPWRVTPRLVAPRLSPIHPAHPRPALTPASLPTTRSRWRQPGVSSREKRAE